MNNLAGIDHQSRKVLGKELLRWMKEEGIRVKLDTMKAHSAAREETCSDPPIRLLFFRQELPSSETLTFLLSFP